MTNNYKALNFNKLTAKTTIHQAAHQESNSVRYEDPAMVVMTDFNRINAFTIGTTNSLDEANHKMMLCGVRMLFVVDESDKFIGLITASDILGEKPVQYMQEHGGSHSEILVMDIMTRRETLEALDITQVARAQVGNIVETFREAGRQHVLVYEDRAEGQREIRGLFSSTQLSRQLGEEIHLNRANSFAELEMALISAV